MALHGLPMLFASSVFFLLNLFLMLKPHHGYGDGLSDPQEVGLCESSVRNHGYKCHEIDVKTQDGYILRVQRIPEGRNLSGDSVTRPPVLLQHGVLVDGMAWFMNAPEQNLPMILADKGFDVWIANTRGTRFSRRHAYLQPNQSEFWNWSWDELAAYDLPAMFDYVYNETGQKLHYVGHSLGGLVALASFSEGLLVNKVKSAALLSPIAYLSHIKTALGVVAAKAFVTQASTLSAEFNPKGEAAASFLKQVCAHPEVNCYDLLTAITGKNCCLNTSTVDLFSQNQPQSTSTKNMVHLSQSVRDKVIAKYNYENPNSNLIHYGAMKPPVYNLSNIPEKLPLFISYGGQDALSDAQDVEQLLDDLKFHDVLKYTVEFVKNYAHADFIMGVSAADIVYDQVYKFFLNHHF
ncbi:triacylglycerol lipase 2 [Manihot esculenta]|uniref:Lipase n=1 Tax=Manihot esculenta TaxID=3983 RepID=A0A2C9UGJ3_MANES|nr:triacylglycerol lipase 2 [Manihot esculenta]OAY29625.1 hypothetical protein MANES_15G159400v8 [Manihot esculenta]